MTAALLLARAGRQVVLYEASGQLGGLWSSQLDAEGFFRSDNSCKVFQPTYTSTPALFELLGLDWHDHFTQRHDLTPDWLRPFVADCSWRDLAILAGGYVQHRLGLGQAHLESVAAFMARHRMSDACQAWMRATALGGIAGTLRMTMWELYHRIGCNLGELLRSAEGPLFWNSRPPNAPGGFMTLWRQALEEHGVAIRTGARVDSLVLHGAGGQPELQLSGGQTRSHAAVLLAVPPPALARLVAGSDEQVSRALGMTRAALRQYLARSVYAHVGVSWFFDRPLPNDLPLGGHNVRRGWHPILVQHDQYQGQLRPPARTVVVGSVAVDTEFRHHRLGTLAREYDLDGLAAIVWDDERRVDPTLPDPIEVVVTGPSSATQIVDQGPLPAQLAGAPVFLATNLHGQSPYFTASLEAAIQAGSIAARHADPAVRGLPMPPPTQLPWPDRAVAQGPGDRTEAVLAGQRAAD